MLLVFISMYYTQMLWTQCYHFYELSLKELTSSYPKKGLISAQTFCPCFPVFNFLCLVNKLLQIRTVLSSLSSRVGEEEGEDLMKVERPLSTYGSQGLLLPPSSLNSFMLSVAQRPAVVT